MQKLLLIGLLLPFISAFAYTVRDYGSMFYVINSTFDLLESHLRLNFSADNDQRVAVDDSLDYVLNGLESFELDFARILSARKEDGAAVYELGSPFNFSVDLLYFWAYGAVPFNGRCAFKVQARNVAYVVKADRKQLSPEFRGKLNLTVENVTNSLAISLGVIEAMEERKATMDDFFFKAIAAVFSAQIKSHFSEVYENSVNLIRFPDLRNFSFAVSRTLTGFQVADTPPVSLVARYESNIVRTPGSLPVVHDADKNCLRCVDFDIKELVMILEQRLSATHNIRLSEEAMSKSSLFHLDKPSLSRIYSELIYEPDELTGVVSFSTNTNKINGGFLDDEKLFKFEGATMDLTISVNNASNTKLATATIELSGKFKPLIETLPGTRKVFLNLNTTEISVNVTKESGEWEGEYTRVNRKGLRTLVRGLMTYYFPKFSGAEVLGTGILLSAIVPADNLKLQLSKTSNPNVYSACLYAE